MSDESTTRSSTPLPVEPIPAEPVILARPRYLLAIAVALGFLVEALLHGSRLGLGYALVGLVVAGGWLLLGRGLSTRPSGSAHFLLTLILLTSALVAVRASPAVQAINILVGIAALLWVAAVFKAGGLTRMSLIEHVAVWVWSGLSTVMQPLLFFFGDLPKARPMAGRGLAPVIWGALLALPLLLIFGGLFVSADAVFAAHLRDLLDWDIGLEDLLARLILSLVLSWGALGLARQAFSQMARGPRSEQLLDLNFLRLSGPTTITMLALVNALFFVFVAVQAVYLFGGADTLARTQLSHSDYARRGFFELVTVASLVLGLVLCVDWLIRSVSDSKRRVINLLNGALIALTLVILVSALQRMLLYVQEFGLTEQRFYTTAFMGWVAVVLVWLAVTVLWRPGGDGQGRRRFAFGAISAGVALALLLNVWNGDAFIAQVNLNRAYAKIGQPLDTAYLAQRLSADATPTLVAAVSRLDGDSRRDLACSLRERAQQLEATAAKTPWRGANLNDMLARRSLQSAQAELAAYATACDSQTR